MSLLQTRLRWQKIARSSRPASLKIAALASFTANPLAPYLGLALEEAGLPPDIWIGPYNQIMPELLSPGSATREYGPDVLICWPRLEELWNGGPLPLTDPPETYTAELGQVAEAATHTAHDLNATLLFVLPAIPELRPLGVGDAANVQGVVACATAAREEVRHRLANRPGVLLFDLEEVIREIGSRQAYHPGLFATARIPFTEETFAAIGERMGRLIRLSRQAARKVLVVDGDNTLWGGVVGEDGVAGVDLADNGPGEAYRALQSYLLELRRSGVLVALSSKNNEPEVWELFKRPAMRLKKEHLAAWRVNWQPKSHSLREMAEELNLGLSSFVFLDDSPVELAEVNAALPEVVTLPMPADPSGWQTVLQGSGWLDRLPPTAEDLQRADQYQQERQRTTLKNNLSAEDYLASLEVAVSFASPDATTLPRLAQLVAKTNQFNLNCRRRSEAALTGLASDNRYIVRLVSAQDRFGDYGIVGVYIVETGLGQAVLDTFLLSCRAMSRQVERAMIANIFQELERRGLTTFTVTVEETPKNEPARRFFAELGCALGQPSTILPQPWPDRVRLNEEAVV